MSEIYKIEQLDQTQEQSSESRLDFQQNLARLMDNIEFVPHPPEYQDEPEEDVYDHGSTLLGEYKVQYLLPSGALIEISQNNDWNEERMFEVDEWYPEDDKGNWASSVPTSWTVRITENGLSDAGKPWSIQHVFAYEPQNPGTEEDRDPSAWRVFHEIEALTAEEIEKEIEMENRDLAERLLGDSEDLDANTAGDDNDYEDIEDDEYTDDEAEPKWRINQSVMAVFEEHNRIAEARQEAHKLGLTLMSEAELVGLNKMLASVDDSMLVKQSVDSYE